MTTATTKRAKVSGVVPFLTGFGVLYAVLAGLAELDATGRYGVAVLAVLLVAVLIERRIGDAGRGRLRRARGVMATTSSNWDLAGTTSGQALS